MGLEIDYIWWVVEWKSLGTPAIVHVLSVAVLWLSPMSQHAVQVTLRDKLRCVPDDGSCVQ